MTTSRSPYEQLGASATKQDIHRAVARLDAGLFPGAFCRIGADVFTGDPDHCCVIHADGAGTKAIVSYLAYRETGATDWFVGLAQDAVVMNLDDLVCVGATDRFLLSNTIGRNSFRIPTPVLTALMEGFETVLAWLNNHGIQIIATGGETADLVDSVRTLVVDATVATRLPRSAVIDNSRIAPGLAIVGIGSTGQAKYESLPNSGIGSNGLTLARHALLSPHYRENYPECLGPELDPRLCYRGQFRLDDRPPVLAGMSIANALLSPTRTHLPIIRTILNELGTERVYGLVHNTGGGLTKSRRFGSGVAFIKDKLFPHPPIHRLIADSANIPWREMCQVYPLGHRFEIYLRPNDAPLAIEIIQSFGLEAQVIGHCESNSSDTSANRVIIRGDFGEHSFE